MYTDNTNRLTWRHQDHPLNRLISDMKARGGLPDDEDLAEVPGGERIGVVLRMAGRKANDMRATGNNQDARDYLDDTLVVLGEETARDPWPAPKRDVPAHETSDEAAARMFGNR